jgi:hypothetical protein
VYQIRVWKVEGLGTVYTALTDPPNTLLRKYVMSL